MTSIYPIFYFSYYILRRKLAELISFADELNVSLVKRFRQIGKYNNTAPTKASSDEKVIEINTTEETTTALRKDISGLLKLKFKQYGSTVDWEDLYEEDEEQLKPSFGFIGDYYVPREIIENSKIDGNCDVDAKVVFSGEKWKVYYFKRKL